MPAFDLAAIGAGLPFAARLPALTEALAGGVAVVQAPPGTGKTTLVPPLLADLAGSGRVVVTAPRRIAVRAAAARLAQLDGSGVGERVGFTVRGERRVSPATRVEFVTPGVLLRRVLADPELPGVAAVALDEVHERGLDTDLLVGMLAQVRALRDDLTLVAMSATLDAPRFARILAGEHAVPAPIVDCPSALHPLDVRWRPAPGPRFDPRGVARDFLSHVAATTVAGFESLPEADALVFLPGAWEIDQVCARLRDALPGVDVLPLHGRLAPREQDRVLHGRDAHGGPRRIVVSTAIAESSLTVPGVRLVVDAGLSREPRRHAARGMSGLVTVAASRDAATQRAGRAARLGPGVAVRCYDEETWARMPAHVTPQIASDDLVDAALLLACWGTPGGRGLALPDAPPAAALADAEAVLRGLGALDADGRATARGHDLAAVPLDPRLARALLDGAETVGRRAAVETVAALADDHRAEDADLGALLARLRTGRGGDAARWIRERRRLEAIAGDRPSRAPERETSPVERRAANRAESAADRAESAAGRAIDRATGRAGKDAPGPAGAATGYVVALAFPERIARLDGEVYLLASGTRAALPPGSPLRGRGWLAIADVARAEGRAAAGTGAVIRAAAPLSSADALLAGAALRATAQEATWQGGRVTARRVERLAAIELSSTPVSASPAASRSAVHDALRRDGLRLLSWSPAADQLRRRLAFLQHHLGEPWPDVGDEALLAGLDAWLGPELDALAAGARPDLHQALTRLLPWSGGQATRLDELAPARLAVPSGRTTAIDYPPVTDAGARPVVAVKLQECFGWAQTPRLADGRVPVVFHLLSPAGRPLAVTDDLASFWSGPYQQVRREMRGRYPKHPWPEDPWTAVATARTTRRARGTS